MNNSDDDKHSSASSDVSITKRVSKPDTLDNWAIFFTVVLCASFALSVFASAHWFADLFRHFLQQYAIGGLIFFAFFACKRRLYWGGVCFAIALLSFGQIFMSASYGAPKVAAEGAKTIKVMHYNRRHKITEHTDFLRWLVVHEPDVLVIQEARLSHQIAMESLRGMYPYRVQEVRHNAFGQMVFSRFPIVSSNVTYTERHALTNFYIHAVLDLGDDQTLSLYAIHPPPPMSASLAKQRNEDLFTVARAIEHDHAENIVMVGDWNCTPYSPHFKTLVGRTGLKNEYTTLSPIPSWPSHFAVPLFQIPIDHILHKGHLELLEKRRGPAMGSDHYPIIATFEVK